MMMLLSISKIAVYSKPYVDFLEFKYKLHVCKKLVRTSINIALLLTKHLKINFKNIFLSS
jgi:hypothetical protein